MAYSYKKVDNVATRRVGGETLLVPISGKLAHLQHVFVLDAVGEHIWAQIDGERDVSAIAQTVPENFEVEPEQATSDCEDYLRELLEAGLLQEAK